MKYLVNETPLARLAVELEARKLNAAIQAHWDGYVLGTAINPDVPS